MKVPVLEISSFEKQINAHVKKDDWVACCWSSRFITNYPIKTYLDKDRRFFLSVTSFNLIPIDNFFKRKGPL